MAKKILPAVLDAALSFVSANAGQVHLCSAEPATFTEATTTYSLAYSALAAGNFTGPADGTAGARKLTLNAVENMNINNTGSVTHVAIVDTANSRILYVTTCAAQNLTSGNKVTIDAFSLILGQPA